MLSYTPKMRHMLKCNNYNIKVPVKKSEYEKKKNAVKSWIFSFNSEIPQDIF